MSSTQPQEPRSTAVDVVDVVVVGAGLSGLAAARNVVQRGASVLVLEANPRVGGRVWSANVADAHIDLGGTFVGPTQDRIIALADEVGVRRYRTFEAGQNLLQWRKTLRRYRGTTPPVGTRALLDLARLRSVLTKLSAQVPCGRPERAPGAADLDAESFGSWLTRHHASQAAKDLMAMVTRTSWGCDPSEVSLLHVLHCVAQAGGFDRMLDTRDGAQEEHFVEGSHEICVRVAAELGDAVRLSTPVRSLEWSPDGVIVRTDSGQIHARQAIVAVPPAMRRRIDFSPELPHGYRMLSQRWSNGVLSKVYVVYETPFWRADGLSGMSTSDQGPIFITFDASPQDESRGVLLGFIGGSYAIEWDSLSDAERRIRALSALRELFGEKALIPAGYIDQRWSAESWIGGGPTAMPGPGAVVPYHQYLARPVGPVHWAGSESSDVWAGYMDGAVRAGERAAHEALTAIKTATPGAQIGAPA